MAEGFDAASPQGFLMYSTSAAAGTAISLVDSNGRELLSGEIPCGFSSVVLSAPGLSVGDVCTLIIGGEREQVTIDNTSSSGFVTAGMFGGGMRGGQGFAGRQDMEPSGALDGGFSPNGMTGQPDGSDFPGNRERPDGMQRPGGADMPDGGNIPDGGERPDQNEFQGTGERPAGPDTGHDREDGMRFPQQDWGQTRPEGSVPSSDLPAGTFALLGVSVLILLAGLLFAVKVKH